MTILWYYHFQKVLGLYSIVFTMAILNTMGKNLYSAFFSIFLFSKRIIYVQALTIIEYLIANGSERAVDDILDHYSKISVCLISVLLLYSHLFDFECN